MSDEGPRAGWCYCLTNDSLNCLKIGLCFGEDPMVRVNDLSNSTSIPTPFILLFAFKFADVRKVEANLHKLASVFGERVNPKREFFRISPDKVRLLMETQNPIEEWKKPETVGSSLKPDRTKNELYMFNGQKVWRTGYKQIMLIWIEDRRQYFIEGTDVYFNSLTAVDKYVNDQLKLPTSPSKKAFERFSTEIDGQEMNLKRYTKKKRRKQVEPT